MKTIRSAFTPAFFDLPEPISPTDSPIQAQKVETPNSRMNNTCILNVNNMRLPQRRRSSVVLAQNELDFASHIDEITNFVDSHANALQPPMSEVVLSEIHTHFSALRSHLFDKKHNFFSSHKEIMFGPVKENFYLFCKLLQNQKISLQQRMTAIVTMSSSMSVCSGGINTALQDGIGTLQHAHNGIRSASYRFKIQIIKAVIADHVQAQHNYLPGNEIHFSNAYFNCIANEMGLNPIKDAFIKSIENEISTENYAACREKIKEHLTPSRLTVLMADDYLNKIKDSVASSGVDINSPLEGQTLTNAFNTTKNLVSATLNAEFGQVPFENFLLSVPKSDHYTLAKEPVLIARHFMEKLQSEKLVNYADVIRLTKSNDLTGDIMILDDLFWINHEGDCREMSLQALLASSPFDFLENLRNQGIQDQQCFEILQSIGQHVLESNNSKDCDEALENWLNAFADIYSANTGACNKAWITPILLLAAKFNSIETLTILIKANIDLSLANSDKQSALMTAAENGRTEALQCLIECGANIEATDITGATPLLYAVYFGQTEAVNLLLAKGANVDAIHPSIVNAVLISVVRHKTEVLQTLVDAGADLEFRNALQQSALILAVIYENINSIEILLKGGAQVDACDSKNCTPAMFALIKGDADIINLLIDYGANLSRFNNDGKTVLDIAKECGHDLLLKKILKEKAESAAENGNALMLQSLIDAGADKESQNSEGQTLTILAAINGHSDALTVLFAAKADLNQRDHNGQTALMHAAMTNNLQALKMLIDAGADTNIIDNAGTSAALHALANFNSGALDMLYKAGAQFGFSTLE